MARYVDQPDGMEHSNRFLDRFRKRMNDISSMLKELKGGFAQDYNRRHKRLRRPVVGAFQEHTAGKMVRRWRRWLPTLI